MWFKGNAALAIDDWYSSGDVRRNLGEAHDLLQSGRPFEVIVNDLDAADHTRSEFEYPLDGALQGAEFERVTRQGFLKAIDLALADDRAVPIKTFWMTGAGNQQFEMHIADGAEHVSVTLLVPDVEGGSDYGPESWLVRPVGEDDVETRQTSGPGREDPSALDTSAS